MSIFDFTHETFKIDKPIRLIELFAGVGSQAMAIGELEADFEHHRVVEFDKYAIASYNAIHGTDFPTMDITKVKGEDLGIVDTDEYCYIMTYSFPCQDLSVAGKGKGMTKGSGTRSGLLWEVERLLNEVDNLPQVLVMENVPMVHGEGNKKDFQKWIEFLESKGYSCWYDDLNAKGYGVAQSRDRCFMVSILGEYQYKFPRQIPLTRKMKDYLEEEVDEKYYINSEKAQELIAKLIESGEIKDGVAWVDKKDVETVEEKSTVLLKSQGSEFEKFTDIAHTLMARDYKGFGNQSMNGVIERDTKHLGNIYGEEYGTGYAGNVWDKEGLSPTLMNMQGGNRQPMVVEDKTICRMIGRNPDNPTDRTPEIPTEQRLEPNSEGICNCLTSVQKDNLVLENAYDFYNDTMKTDGVVGTITTGVAHNGSGTFGVVETVRIREATKKGYAECKIGGVADLLYPTSTTRRGRVQDMGDTCPTILSGENGIHRIESMYRIRKLTPKECWRLMDFKDEDFHKAEQVNSNTQLYKQAGNSIVKNVLVAIFGQMIPGKENVYKERFQCVGKAEKKED